MNVTERFNIHWRGNGAQPMLFAHGYGCDQSMWRWVAPAFEPDHRVILFDLAGSGRAHPSAYDRSRHATLHGYARDVLDIIEAMELRDLVFVGHSVSAITGILAAIERPELFDSLVLISPSPCYVDVGDYCGGFARKDLDGMIDTLDSNYPSWAGSIAPVIMGTPDRPDLFKALEQSFCRAQPECAREFAKVAFLSDNRAELVDVRTRSLILQVTDDVIAPVSVGQFMQRNMPDSELVLLKARGHCPHMSAPEQTIAVMQGFLARDGGHG